MLYCYMYIESIFVLYVTLCLFGGGALNWNNKIIIIIIILKKHYKMLMLTQEVRLECVQRQARTWISNVIMLWSFMCSMA